MIKEILYKWFKIEEKPCSACEALKMQLGIANNEKERLLSTILSLTQPKPEIAPTIVQPESMKRRAIPWNEQRRLLEAEDRRAAQIIAQQQKEHSDRIQANIAELEKELGVQDAQAVRGNVQETVQPVEAQGGS